MPELEVIFVGRPDTFSPIGIKGPGELGIIGVNSVCVRWVLGVATSVSCTLRACRPNWAVCSDNTPEKEAHLALLCLGILGPLRMDVGVRTSDLSALPHGLRLFPIS
jgi:hypothetical protein